MTCSWLTTFELQMYINILSKYLIIKICCCCFFFSLISGHFPLESVHCLAWICLDVLFCTASIMHLCTISIDRYLSLRYPMRFGRNKTRKRVIVKIIFVWLLSIAMSLPLSLMYSKVCVPFFLQFVLVGSLCCCVLNQYILYILHHSNVGSCIGVSGRNVPNTRSRLQISWIDCLLLHPARCYVNNILVNGSIVSASTAKFMQRHRNINNGRC